MIEEEYIYQDDVYTLSYYNDVENDTVIFPSTDDNKLLLEVFTLPTSSVIQYTNDEVRLFNTGEEAELYLISHSTFDSNLKSVTSPQLTVDCYENINYGGARLYPPTYANWHSGNHHGIKSLSSSGWDDKISSIYGDGSGLSTWITFYEHNDFNGKSLSYSSGPGIFDYYVIRETNLHNKKMKQILWKKWYWGDNISSIKWEDGGSY